MPGVNLVPNAAEELGRVPSFLVWLRPGLQMMQDPVDGQVVFVDDDGHVAGRAALPAQFRIGEAVAEADRVRLVEMSGRSQVMIPRSIDPGAVTALSASAVDGGAAKRLSRLFRTNAQQLQLQLNDTDRRSGAAQLNIRSVTGGALAQGYEIGAGTGGANRYVVSEEIVASTPALRVRVFAQRFDRAGRVTGIAHLSLDGMDVVPRDFVTVTGEGVLRTLVPTAGGVKIREIQFSEPPYVNSQSGRLSEDDLKSLGNVGREIPVDTNIRPPSGALDARPNRSRLILRAATPPITRERALVNARGYLTVNWVMTPANYSQPRIANLCEPEQAKFWLRPTHFTPDVIGKTIGPMPYRWGGDDTPDSFKLRVQYGALAGDICTCRDPALDYCLVPESAGVDCSGFVSKAWGIEKRGTSGLLDVATELSDIADLRPGDAFVWPGHHVRLFTGLDAGAGVAYTVLESTTKLQCEGVCQSSYRPSELNGYQLIKYRGMTN
jgi:cell wall-associated NlpC family hydrolase